MLMQVMPRTNLKNKVKKKNEFVTLVQKFNNSSPGTASPAATNVEEDSPTTAKITENLFIFNFYSPVTA
jgi:hypothetical protein